MNKIFKIGHVLIILLVLKFNWCDAAITNALTKNPLFYQEVQSRQGKKIDSDIFTLILDNASLKNTLQLLTNRLGKNMLLDSDVSERELNFNLKNLTPLEAFNAILVANNLAYSELEGNVLFIAKAEKIVKQTVVKNINCKYANVEDLEKILNNMVISDFGKIMSDKRTNTLVIKESPDVIIKMQRLIAELDRPTKQVYIQAEIVEISSTDNNELGIEWLWKTANYKSIQGQIGSNFDLTSEESSLKNSNSVPFPSSTGLGIGILNTDVNAVLHALSERNNINLLSRPRIITLDNQEAIIEVGDQIPFKKLNQFGVTSFEFKDATVQLVVKPHIIDSEYVLLQVSPKADFQNGFTPDGTPIISTRKASTNVKVKNGQTIVIGGLIRDSLIKSEKKVPILGSIPILGLLFKSSKSTNVKTELIVFITPIILEDGINPKIFKHDFKTKYNIKKKFK